MESNLNPVCDFRHDTYPPGLGSLCKIQVYPEVTTWLMWCQEHMEKHLGSMPTSALIFASCRLGN